MNLAGWKLDDVEGGGSRPYTFSSDTILPAGGIISFSRSDTGIALNNGGDTIRLVDFEGQVVATQTYEQSVGEGWSMNRNTDGTYAVSTTVTAGKSNIITVSNDFSEGSVASAVAIDIHDIRSYSVGTVVTFDGVVSVPPSLLGKRVMYVAGSGIQLYLSSGEFPGVGVGDRVTVTGELGEYAGEMRVKLSSADALVVHGVGPSPVSVEVKTGGVGELLEGQLVKISGSVVDPSGSTFYVDDGSGRVRIVVKASTGIQKPRTATGTIVNVVGVVSQTKSGYRILPRFQDDIVVVRAGGKVKASKSVVDTRSVVSELACENSPHVVSFPDDVRVRVVGCNTSEGGSKHTFFILFGLCFVVLQLVGGARSGEPLLRFFGGGG